VANSTQLVSLPRKWAEKYNIKKGDELEIEEQGNRLVVSSQKEQGHKSIDINVTDLDRDSLMYYIRALYIKGYDEIKVIFDEPTVDHYRLRQKVKTISMIHEEVNRLSGMEIIQQKENFCVIKDIAQGSVKEFDVVLRRIFLLLVDASSDLLKGGKEGDLYLVDSLQEKHNTITKFITNNLRLLNKGMHPEHKNIQILYFIIAALDNITDVLKDCARDIVASKMKLSKETESILNTINTSLKEYVEFYYKFNIAFLKTMTFRRYKMLEDIKKFSKKVNTDEYRLIMNMWNIMEQLLDLTITRVELEY
jgi:phosphate uptake regulator